MRDIVVYTLARLGLFAVMAVLLWLLGFSAWATILLALVLSGVLSYVLLRRRRVAVAMAVEAALQRRRERVASRTSAEDAYVDAVLATGAVLRPGDTRNADDGRSP